MAFKFNTLNIANEAMNLLNEFHGLPFGDGITKFSIDSCQLIDGSYYIGEDSEWTKPLDGVYEKVELPPTNQENTH